MEKLLKALGSQFYNYEFIHTYRTYTAYGKTHYYDFCVLSEKPQKGKAMEKGKKIIRFQKRFFGVTKQMKKDGVAKPRWVVYDTFNLNVKKDFPSFFKVISSFKEGKIAELKSVVDTIDFNKEVQQIAKLNRELRTISKTKKKTKSDIVELKKKQDKINSLAEEINKLNDENRKLKLQSFKSNVGEYRSILKTLWKALDTKKKDENYFQRELTNNKWIFGAWYEDVIPKRKADAENQPDFVLKRYDGFADVVEIEAPGKILFTKPNKSKKIRPSHFLTEAFNQAIDYIDSYNDAFKDEFYKDATSGVTNPLNPYRPKALVIIGRDNNSERHKLRQYNSFLNNVSVFTYDEFLKNAEAMLNFIEKKKLN